MVTAEEPWLQTSGQFVARHLRIEFAMPDGSPSSPPCLVRSPRLRGGIMDEAIVVPDEATVTTGTCTWRNRPPV
jgi:hypothetical protein